MGLKRMHSSRILFTAPLLLSNATANAQVAAANETSAPTATTRAASEGAPAARAPISSEERHRMIAKAAYGRAERSGFRSDPIENWLVAEREVDALLARMAS